MKKRLLSTLLALCVALALLPATALAAETSGFCGDNVTWSYSNGTLTIQGTGLMENYYPAEPSAWVEAEEIKRPWSDFLEQIHTVNIGQGVTNITDFAFVGCTGLTGVTIPDSVTSIGAAAFEGCLSLTSVTIPDSVTSLGAEAFNSCASLTSVTFSNNLTGIAPYTFAGCESLTGLTIPNSVTNIEFYAFLDCNSLTSVTIPASVTDIGGGAFELCTGLRSVTIPASITNIEVWAFGSCDSLTDVYYGGSESQWEQIFARNEYVTVYDVFGDSSGSNGSNGNLPTIHYNSAGSSAPGAPGVPSTGAVLSPQKLMVDGKDIDCEKYNIGGSNYFKLRDLAQLLSGTGSRFGVGFDEATSTVTITTGEAYESTGTELVTGADNSDTAQPSRQSILIDGVAHSELTAYNIGGSNFFQLRELGNVLGFEVDYDIDTNTAIVRSAGN